MSVFTLDEWEKSMAGAKTVVKNELPDTSRDEDLACQLQNQLDMEDPNVHICSSWVFLLLLLFAFSVSGYIFFFHVHVQRGKQDMGADDIRMSMFNYERDDDRACGMEHGGRGRGRGEGGQKGGGEEDMDNFLCSSCVAIPFLSVIRMYIFFFCQV
ncbi:uncharacterized protein LOC119993820 isoform X2 [Tripterygium wilfordii]|nr:uncharacterized protein LOC119993820 isoform X2 [Tripterygium wilfordii]